MEVKQITDAPTSKTVCKDCRGCLPPCNDTAGCGAQTGGDSIPVGRGLAPAAISVPAVYKEIIACFDTTHPPAEPVPLPFIKGRHVAAKPPT